ncbi:MAG: imidazole glycerol phosphate synthase subunit HisH [Bacteroidales bacterium]|nr:imidazole glycerol phosphate synthase subunit HisH [Bacteroidales bacterium]
MSIAIVKYNAGNVFSVQCALQRIGVDAVITDDFEALRRAEKVIFPGVGEASTAMDYLRERGLDEVIKNLTQPVLGICIGLQLLCRSSEEGDAQCMGIFDTDIKRFDNSLCAELKIPHMGWNTLEVTTPNLLIPESLRESYVYYVHSYYAPVCRHTIATTDYVVPFSAALHRDNFYATQFHPEKSGDVGETILKQFMAL